MSKLRRLLPSLNGLLAFEAAVRCGTFASAAEELGVTGPAVSRTIGRLEGYLGVKLFLRKPTGAELTTEGSDLFAAVTKGFSEIERSLTRLTQSRRTGRRPIVLSVSSAFATHWFMPRLAAFHERFPGEEIQFQLMSGAMRGPVDGVDLAMRYDYEPSGEEVLPLMEELLLPVCAPNFVSTDRADAIGLDPLPRMITLSDAQPDWSSIVSRAGEPFSVEQFALADYSLVVQAALVGQGIALGWLNTVSLLLAQGTLVPASKSVIRTGRQCQLVIGQSDRRTVLQQIYNWIKHELAQDLIAIRSKYPDVSGLPHRPSE
jgi:LysR family transcriptional regulator, glycine cleavage system transcriptional activator